MRQGDVVAPLAGAFDSAGEVMALLGRIQGSAPSLRDGVPELVYLGTANAGALRLADVAGVLPAPTTALRPPPPRTRRHRQGHPEWAGDGRAWPHCAPHRGLGDAMPSVRSRWGIPIDARVVGRRCGALAACHGRGAGGVRRADRRGVRAERHHVARRHVASEVNAHERPTTDRTRNGQPATRPWNLSLPWTAIATVAAPAVGCP